MVVGWLAAMTLMQQAFGATCARDPAVELDGTIARTVAAVQRGDAAGFLNLVSDDGIALNPEGGQVGFRSLQSQFDSKSGAYCALFICAGKPGELGARFKPGPVDKQIDVKHGLATVFINANTNDELDLNYKLNDCRWELTGISAVE